MARVQKIGDPENASELKAIRYLAEKLPDQYVVFHNFELTTGSGLPYEFDIAVVADFAVWHVEVKGYRGAIRGDQHQWIFENGGVQPSPIPLANKKSKILAGRLRRHSRRLEEAFVDTVILLTDELARVRLKDEQASRVIRLDQAQEYLTDPSKLPVRPADISRLRESICDALYGTKSSHKVAQIGLYDIVEKINQTDERTVFLARHRFIKTRPQTILKVFHFDIYSSQEQKNRQIEAIFHDQNAMRLLGAHPNLIDTGDMFAWDDNKFVLPTEYVEQGRPLSVLLQKEEDRQLTWKDKADIVAKMARGLGHAHQRGVIHRDIRPLNVVVAPCGVVKLVNFDLAFLEGAPQLSDPRGLAQRLDPRYTAPEVWLDPAAATRRSDVYSLGILFYELITSRPPFEDVSKLDPKAETPLDRELLLSELSTPGSEDFMPSPKDAADVIARMCKKNPSERYASVEGVIEDLAILT